MTSQIPGDILRRRSEAIAWVRAQIACYGLTLQELQDAGCFAAPAREPPAPRYRNAEGQTWDGQGAMPDWLRRAVNAGQSLEHFSVADVRR